MTSSENDVELRKLYHTWRRHPERRTLTARKLRFSDFAEWLKSEGHGEHLHHMHETNTFDAAKRLFDRGLI